ncbi:MAG: hypothetical protein SAK29_10885 [Scytonema sp. PMC 1069.18]|nr:hypothetical protein [Scytonema sp. PMC 1069.18]MEC4887167.1 hypothetical protein [Scytonema sp. PMC 1070.18]
MAPNPEKENRHTTPGSTSHGTGSLAPDAGVDTARADYSDVAGTPDIIQPNSDDNLQPANLNVNGPAPDDQNVDQPIPEGFSDDEDTNVVDRQLGVISRLPG